MMQDQFVVFDAIPTSEPQPGYYFDWTTARFMKYETFTRGADYVLVPRVAFPLRGEDYHALAAIWENDEDDDAFGDSA